KGLDELRPTIGRCQAGHCPANKLQPVVMVILISPARHGQPVMFILDQTPNQIVQWSQRVELQLAQWVVWPTAPILEPERDSVHGLCEHALFMPVRPNQLQKTGTGQSMLQDAKAIGQDFVYPVGVYRQQGLEYPSEIWESLVAVKWREIPRQAILQI